MILASFFIPGMGFKRTIYKNTLSLKTNDNLLLGYCHYNYPTDYEEELIPFNHWEAVAVPDEVRYIPEDTSPEIFCLIEEFFSSNKQEGIQILNEVFVVARVFSNYKDIEILNMLYRALNSDTIKHDIVSLKELF